MLIMYERISQPREHRMTDVIRIENSIASLLEGVNAGYGYRIESMSKDVVCKRVTNAEFNGLLGQYNLTRSSK